MNSIDVRMELLASLEMVDWVVPFAEDTPLRLITLLKPDILVKGGDYEADQIIGSKEVRSWGGDVYTLPFHDGYSTTSIIETLKEKT